MTTSTLFRKRSRKTTKLKSQKLSVYKSIEDLPVWNYIQINETRNLNFLYKLEDYSNIPKIHKRELNEIWTDINQQIFDEFGVSENYKRWFRLLKEKIRVRNQFIQTQDRFLLNDIFMIEEDINMIFDGTEKQKFDVTWIAIEKFMSHSIDPRKTSVKKYFYYLDFINKQNSENGSASK